MRQGFSGSPTFTRNRSGKLRIALVCFSVLFPQELREHQNRDALGPQYQKGASGLMRGEHGPLAGTEDYH